MQTPEQVLETYFLDHRHQLLEIAAFMDRYDAAVAREGAPADDEAQLKLLQSAINQLRSPAPEGGRVKQMLELFS